MKKIIIMLLFTLVTVSALGCFHPKDSSQPAPSNSDRPQEQIAENFKPNLGGICLGDSKEQVIKAFGTEYTEKVYDDPQSLGEPFVVMHFDDGIDVVLSKNDHKVLEISIESAAISTNLGYKIGDKAQAVLDTYRARYPEPDSRHEEGKLMGWFIINDNEDLVIFDFTRDEIWVNLEIKPDARVERIKLTNSKYLD